MKAARACARLPPSSQLYLWGRVALIALASCVAYLPALRGEFILDDDMYLTDAPVIQAADGLRRIWFTSEVPDYYPVSNTSLWLEWRLWGANPTGYHVTNLLLHLASCLLIWAVLRQLAIPGAFLAALLFAVHPLNVESVAWIAQRKGLLALVFFLLSILGWLQADVAPTPASPSQPSHLAPRLSIWYWLSFAAFVLAVLSKGSAVILPLVLLLIVWWQRGRLTRWDLLRSAPFWAIAIALAFVNVWCQHRGLSESIRPVSFAERLSGAGAVVWFYLSKALAPIDLVFVYPQWHIQTTRLNWWLPLAAAALVTALLWRHRRNAWSWAMLFAWAFFCATLVPVLGFTDVGFMQYSLVADHYQHVALIAVAALAAAAWSTWCTRASGAGRQVAWVVGVAVVATLTTLTRQQSTLYTDAITLYQTTLSNNPSAWIIQNNLGQKLYLMGDLAGARRHYEEALRLHPEYPDALHNLGIILACEGRLQEAIEFYQHALRIYPAHAKAHNDLGLALFDTDRNEEAIEQFQQAVKLKPDFAVAYFNLANVLAKVGRMQEALQQYRQVVRLNPDMAAEVHAALGVIKAETPQQAVEEYQKALQLKPDMVVIRYDLGNALVKLGRLQEAIEQYQQVVRQKPDFPEAHYKLGDLLAKENELPEAIEHYQEALRLKPDYGADIHCNLGIALAKANRLPEAIEQEQQAVQLKPNSAEIHYNLGNALLKAGRAQESIQQYQQALRLKPDFVEACNSLGAALLVANRPQESLAYFEQALRLKSDYIQSYGNLANAYAQLNRSAEAIAAAEKGLDLARSQDQKALARQIDAWLRTYRASKRRLATQLHILKGFQPRPEALGTALCVLPTRRPFYQ